MLGLLTNRPPLTCVCLLSLLTIAACAGHRDIPDNPNAQAAAPGKKGSSADCTTAMGVGYMWVPPGHQTNQGGFNNVPMKPGQSITAFTDYNGDNVAGLKFSSPPYSLSTCVDKNSKGKTAPANNGTVISVWARSSCAVNGTQSFAIRGCETSYGAYFEVDLTGIATFTSVMPVTITQP
jgi:hypothetical protein